MLIHKLLHFIDIEADAQNEQIKELWEKPLAERVNEGQAIQNVEVLPMHGYHERHFGRVNRHYKIRQLRCPENLSKFREGDQLRLHQGHPTDEEEVYTVKIMGDGGTELMIEGGFKSNLKNLKAGKGWILDRDLMDVRDILKNVLRNLKETTYLKKTLGILSGEIKPNFSSVRVTKGLHLAEKYGLNESQITAFSQAYSTNNYYIIQGPPGTGKTFVLARLAEQFAKEGERVLVTALSHRAINNALRKIKETTDYPKMAKIGQRYNAKDLQTTNGNIPNFESLQQSPFSKKTKNIILGATCFSLHSNRLRSMTFDTIIFDEAGQLTLPIAIAGMVKAKRYIFIGDHQQMSPIIIGQHDDETLTKSVFETIFQHTPGTMLNMTYRMNAAINRFPSQYFYNNQLESAPSAVNRKLELNYVSEKFPIVLDPDKPDVFVDLQHKGCQIRSFEEANYIANVIEEAIKCGVPAYQIAVIAPFRAQGRLIRNLLMDRLDWEDRQNILVDTVERIQGQERDIIIISLTTSDTNFAAQNADFFFQTNRLNVAITRPRVKRIMVGSKQLMETEVVGEGLKKGFEAFRVFYKEVGELVVV